MAIVWDSLMLRTGVTISLCFFFSVNLIGCQQKNNPVKVTDKTEYLATLMTSLRYLREDCGYTDIPSGATFSEKLLSEVNSQKQWQLGFDDLKNAENLSDQYYRVLVADPAPYARKCTTLVSSTMPVLKNVMSRK